MILTLNYNYLLNASGNDCVNLYNEVEISVGFDPSVHLLFLKPVSLYCSKDKFFLLNIRHKMDTYIILKRYKIYLSQKYRTPR